MAGADEVEVPLCNNNWIGALSQGTDVHEIVFRETSGSYDLDWHTAPCRQFIIMTQGFLGFGHRVYTLYTL